jgi:hypothetical protein
MGGSASPLHPLLLRGEIEVAAVACGLALNRHEQA